MRQAIIDFQTQHSSRGQHAGLVLQRYHWRNATGEDGSPEERRNILRAAIAAADALKSSDSLYQAAFERWSKILPKDPAPIDLQTKGRLIVGLGSENVLETGIRMHHNYGMPIIPGSALKGLAAHYCDQVWGVAEPKFRKTTAEEDEAYRKYLKGHGEKPEDNFHRLLFGTTDDSGCIIFHDAWYVPNSPEHPLVQDVMTPHHPNWLDGSTPPTDFDSPRPVPFLSVVGKFRIAVSWKGPQHADSQNWAEAALSLLKQALADWGIGGKTSSGYGRLVENLEHADNRDSANAKRAVKSDVPVKRSSGTLVTVRIVGKRSTGFDVQEAGRPQGTLTVGTPPTDLEVNIGDETEVEVHNDDQKRPQYRWPNAKPPNASKKKR